MTVYRAHTTRGRLEVQDGQGNPVVFTTAPALYEMTNEEANTLRRKWGDRVVCSVMDDPPETSDEDQAITGPSPSGRVRPQESEPEATAEATEPEAPSEPEGEKGDPETSAEETSADAAAEVAEVATLPATETSEKPARASRSRAGA